ncbi:MAG: hypothetical protein H6606_04005 [Flavobacteriales bacterium]|nr:hypothetical protein [Flavobacteriales bacterium]
MRIPFLGCLMFLLFSTQAIAQATDKNSSSIGVEFQAYPAGLMPGIQFEYQLAEHHAAHIRLGANYANRRDWGKHDDERGSGIGGTLGYRYRGEWRGSIISSGFRTDIWDMRIRWSNTTTDMGQQSIDRGETSILVVQPTLEIGWWKVFAQRWTLGICVSNGYEINVRTQGEPVGEGAITLLGINLLRSI